MPTSKRRKPKQHLAPNAMPPYQAKAHFKQLAQMDGRVFRLHGRTYEPHGPQDTAFTNAWTHAQATGLDYAEGVAWRDDTGWIAHAWCVTPTGTIVEVTTGFTGTATYKGWILDRKEAQTINGSTTPTRPILETGLSAGGGQWTDLLKQITKKTTIAA